MHHFILTLRPKSKPYFSKSFTHHSSLLDSSSLPKFRKQNPKILSPTIDTTHSNQTPPLIPTKAKAKQFLFITIWFFLSPPINSFLKIHLFVFNYYVSNLPSIFCSYFAPSSGKCQDQP